MTDSRRDEYLVKLKAKLDEWKAQIDELEAKARQQKARLDQRNAERLAELKRQRDQARDKLDELHSATSGAWESLKSGADDIWANVKRTLEDTKKAFEEGKR